MANGDGSGIKQGSIGGAVGAGAMGLLALFFFQNSINKLEAQQVALADEIQRSMSIDAEVKAQIAGLEARMDIGDKIVASFDRLAVEERERAKAIERLAAALYALVDPPPPSFTPARIPESGLLPGPK